MPRRDYRVTPTRRCRRLSGLKGPVVFRHFLHHTPGLVADSVTEEQIFWRLGGAWVAMAG